MPTDKSSVTLNARDYLNTDEQKPQVDKISYAASLWECDTVWWR